MGRSNAAWSTGRGRGLVDVRVLRVPCLMCGAHDRCGVRVDPPALVVCYKTPSSERSADDGFIHRLNDAQRATLPDVPSVAPGVERAPIDALDAAYRAVVARCGLSREHREALRDRGLDAEHIERAGYATLEASGRAALGRAMVDAVGAELAARVPGYVTRSKDGRSWPSVAGWPGLLIPCRDERGRIAGIQVRRDVPNGGPRYVWLSSRSQGGASASTFAHVPIVRPDARRDEVLVTEGPLKADVVTALDGRLCIAVPGVSAWRSALDVLEVLRPSRVLVAFDVDLATNPAVRAAHDSLCSALLARSITCASLRWPPELGKGLDDALLSHLRKNRS